MERLIERADVLPVEVDFSTPRFFGAEGQTPQETYIVDNPLKIISEECLELSTITRNVVDFIDRFRLDQNHIEIGVDPVEFSMAKELDRVGNSTMVYGGLDIYQDKDSGFKVLEINPRVQAMGLQDFRQDLLGIEGPPRILENFLEWINSENYRNVLLLGSKKNPFWRGYQRIEDTLVNSGYNADFCDAQSFKRKYEEGFIPDLIIKLCNNEIFLNGQTGEFISEVIQTHKIRVVNSLTSVYSGYRGFMAKLADELPDLLPSQKIIQSGVNEDDVRTYPWLKLEASGKAYVVNFLKLRKWTRDSIIFLINKDLQSAKDILKDKDGGDAQKLKNVTTVLESTPDDEVVWLAQQDVQPRIESLSVNGVETPLKILHRVYWVKTTRGLQISLEGFGCTHEQFERSKGKINAMTGVSVPMYID